MFSEPDKIIEQLNLRHGSHIADLGAGSGFYSLSAARAVGDRGRVYAVEVQKDLIERLKKHATAAGFRNVEVIWGDAEKMGGTKLKDESMDFVIAANLLFQLEDPHNFPIEVKRILKPKGRVLLVDWTDSFRGMGPSPQNVFTKKQAVELFERVGFSFEKEARAGGHHWGVIMKKN